MSPLPPPYGRADKRARSGRLAPRRAKRARPTGYYACAHACLLCPLSCPLFYPYIKGGSRHPRRAGVNGTGTHRAIGAGKYRAHMHLRANTTDSAYTGAFNSPPSSVRHAVHARRRADSMLPVLLADQAEQLLRCGECYLVYTNLSSTPVYSRLCPSKAQAH